MCTRYDDVVTGDTHRDRCREYVRIWASNGPLLDQVRDRDIRDADTASSIQMFDTAFRIALRDLPPRNSSGLEVWQEYMMRWRNRG